VQAYFIITSKYNSWRRTFFQEVTITETSILPNALCTRTLNYIFHRSRSGHFNDIHTNPAHSFIFCFYQTLLLLSSYTSQMAFYRECLVTPNFLRHFSSANLLNNQTNLITVLNNSNLSKTSSYLKI